MAELLLKQENTDRLHQACILVVEDNVINARLVGHVLANAGFLNVQHAYNGLEALQKTIELKPDLVILDIMMPIMDGFQYCEALRTLDVPQQFPIIVQTSLDDNEQKMQAFALGACDYVCKPVNPSELVARSKVHLTQKIMNEELHRYHTRVSKELSTAHLMQRSLLPSPEQVECIKAAYGLNLESHFQLSSELGGDCWGFHVIDEDRLGLFCYDFSGHGVTSAFNVFRMHALMQEAGDEWLSPSLMLAFLNNRLHTLLERGMFATLFYGVIDIKKNTLTYASAAAPPPLLFGVQPYSVVRALESSGFLLGAIRDAKYPEQHVPFHPQDGLVLYSDALIETPDAKGEFIAMEALFQTFAGHEQLPSEVNKARYLLDRLLHTYVGHSEKAGIDDLTLISLERR